MCVGGGGGGNLPTGSERFFLSSSSRYQAAGESETCRRGVDDVMNKLERPSVRTGDLM